MRWSRLYLWTILATVVAAIALFFIQISSMVYRARSGELFVSLTLAFGFAVIGLACAAACENGKAPMLMRSGMIGGVVALAGWIATIFVPDLQVSMTPLRLFVWPTAWAWLMALVGMLLLLRMHSGWRRGLRCLTIVMLSVLALYIAGAFLLYPDGSYMSASGTWDESVWRRQRDFENAAFPIGAAMTLLTAGALVTTLIIGLVGALTGRKPAIATATPIPYWLECPRCGCEQEARTGDHHCVSCRLRTRIAFA